MKVASLYRYPVKGLSPEQLSSVQLAAGAGFPLDRRYALLRTEAGFDPAAPVWLPKANFVMLMLHEQAAGLRTRYSAEGEQLSIRTPDGHERVFSLGSPTDRAALGRFFLDFLPKRLTAAPRLVEADGHQFTDKAEKYVSLINLASVRELENRWGQALDPLRFRANIYIDGAAPFEELEWIGRAVKLGSVLARVEQRNGRCAATNVNPQTGVRDRDVPGKLRAEFGHKDLGVYLRIAAPGLLREGDAVEIGSDGGASRETPGDVANASGKAAQGLICSACYYLFDPRTLNAAWSGTYDLPGNWRCPDCGAGKEACVPASEHRPRP
ncbi:MAG: MOSC domain-containing protein [Betaproteobacteria bacterium]|nr:MOSC domain-containing protein [Betaproteobacteria bacterium]